MSKYEYEWDENVELSIYHLTPQSLFFNNFVNFLKFSNFLNIENFIIKIKKNKKKMGCHAGLQACFMQGGAG